MKKNIIFIFMLLSVNIFAQKLEIVEELHHKGSFPTAECKKDNGGNYCAVIDVILPGVYKIDFESDLIVEKVVLIGIQRLFVSIPNKPKEITLRTNEYLPFKFKVSKDNLKGREIYEIVLKKSEKQVNTKKRDVLSNCFSGCLYSVNAPFGISMGYCKRFGFMLDGGFSPCVFNKFKIRNIYPSVLLDDTQFKESKNKGIYRAYAHFGAVYRPKMWLLFYASAGYGNYADVLKYGKNVFAPKIVSGLECEAGIMCKVKRLGLLVCCQRNISEEKFVDFGIGINLWWGR